MTARGLKFLISPKIIHCPAIVFSLLLSSMPVDYKNLTHFFLLRLLRFKWIIIDQLFSLSHFPDVLKNKTYFHLWFHFFLTVLISQLMNNNFFFTLGSPVWQLHLHVSHTSLITLQAQTSQVVNTTKLIRKIWPILFRNKGWKRTLKLWNQQN